MTIDDIREEIGRRIVVLNEMIEDRPTKNEDLHVVVLELKDLERWITPDVTTTPLDPKPLGGNP